jgi:hypothetical protein
MIIVFYTFIAFLLNTFLKICLVVQCHTPTSLPLPLTPHLRVNLKRTSLTSKQRVSIFQIF